MATHSSIQQTCYFEVFWTSSYDLHIMGFPGGSVVKNPPTSAGGAGEVGSSPGWARSPGEGNGNPLQYSCLENPMDRGAWWAAVHGVTKESHTTEYTRGGCDVSQLVVREACSRQCTCKKGSRDTSCLCPSGHMLSFY